MVYTYQDTLPPTTRGMYTLPHPGIYTLLHTLGIPHPARQRVYIPVPGPAAGDRALGSRWEIPLGRRFSGASFAKECAGWYTRLRRVTPLFREEENR